MPVDGESSNGVAHKPCIFILEQCLFASWMGHALNSYVGNLVAWTPGDTRKRSAVVPEQRICGVPLVAARESGTTETCTAPQRLRHLIEELLPCQRADRHASLCPLADVKLATWTAAKPPFGGRR